jgi:hypothetical protein
VVLSALLQLWVVAGAVAVVAGLVALVNGGAVIAIVFLILLARAIFGK